MCLIVITGTSFSISSSEYLPVAFNKSTASALAACAEEGVTLIPFEVVSPSLSLAALAILPPSPPANLKGRPRATEAPPTANPSIPALVNISLLILHFPLEQNFDTLLAQY